MWPPRSSPSRRQPLNAASGRTSTIAVSGSSRRSRRRSVSDRGSVELVDRRESGHRWIPSSRGASGRRVQKNPCQAGVPGRLWDPSATSLPCSNLVTPPDRGATHTCAHLEVSIHEVGMVPHRAPPVQPSRDAASGIRQARWRAPRPGPPSCAPVMIATASAIVWLSRRHDGRRAAPADGCGSGRRPRTRGACCG